MLGLMILDMQKWMFRHPERAAQIPGLLTNINTLAAAFAEARLPIINVETIHKADRSTWSRLMRKYNLACLIAGTEDVEPVAGYRPPVAAVRIEKTANSAFLGTDLEWKLQTAGVSELVITGVFIDGCVGLTAADAAQRGYEVTLVADAIGHARRDRRTVIFDWLASDYELSVLSADQARGRLRDRSAGAGTS